MSLAASIARLTLVGALSGAIALPFTSFALSPGNGAVAVAARADATVTGECARRGERQQGARGKSDQLSYAGEFSLKSKRTSLLVGAYGVS